MSTNHETRDPRFTTPQFKGDMMIWGKGYLSYYTDEELREMKKEFRKMIDSTRKSMQFADHGAYGQDRERIEEWEANILRIEWWEGKYRSNPG